MFLEVDGEVERTQQASEIRELAAHIHAAEARLATMVNDFTADGMWNASGDWRSVTNWLTTNCAYTPAAASRLASVAKRVDTMPEVMGHAREGRISLSVAATIAAVVTPETDHQFATIATNATPTQTARMVALYRDQTTAAPDDSGAAETDFWNTWLDHNNRWRVNGSLPPEIGALIDEAFEASRAAATRTTNDDTGTDTDTDDDGGVRSRPSIADIMRAFAEHALNTARDRRLRREGGEHFGVTVLIDLETLVTGTLRPTSICKLESGPHVTPGLVRRLAEEGYLQVLMHQGGVPLWLGHKIRLANRDQRRALRFRDGGCAVPGCGVTTRLHAHHIAHWPGGPTDIDNLVLVCAFHHRMIHHNNWTVTTTGNQQFVFHDSTGRQIGNRLVTDSRPPPGPLEQRPDQQALDIDRWTAKPNPCGDPLTDWAANVWLHALLTAA